MYAIAYVIHTQQKKQNKVWLQPYNEKENSQ